MRNRIAIVLLYLSWPVCIVHRIWNNASQRDVRWIIFDKTVCQDFRWYWTYNELLVSSVLVLVSFLIVKTKTRNFNIVLWALLLVSFIDVVNYWFWFRRNEWALSAEGAVMFISAILILKNESTIPHEKTS